MKGSCDNVICQICQKEMSFGRIKFHINSSHKEISLEQYLKLHYKTLPQHQPCIVCKEHIVYKYQTCSKQCRSVLTSQKLKGIPKPDLFMSKEHKEKIMNARLGNKGGFTGHKHSLEVKEKISKRTSGKKYHLGHKQSEHQKHQASEGMLNYYAKGNQPWTKNNKHTPETIQKIFAVRKMNKLEHLVSSVLKENNINYYFQFVLSKDLICKVYDFKIKGKNILLEIDGDYFHGGPSCIKPYHKIEDVKQNDIFKNELAVEKGFTLLRFWESEIKNNPNLIIEQLSKYL